MPGTFSATVTPAAVAQNVTADFGGSGALDMASISPTYTFTEAFSGAGNLAATSIPRLTVSAVLSGTGALTATGSQKYAVAAGLGSTGQLTATVTSNLLDFTDTFNRADNASPGSPWVAAAAPSGDWSISGNKLVSTDFTNGDGIYYGPLSKDGQKVTVTMGFNSVGAATFYLLIGARTSDDGSGTGGVYVGIVNYDSVTTYVGFIMRDASGNPVGSGSSRGDLQFVAGDTFTLETLGDDAWMLKNGVPILFDTDPSLTTLNAGERTVEIRNEAEVTNPANTLKIDQIRIQEIESMGAYVLPPTTIENTNIAAGTTVPAGYTGAWVTLIGAGGGGGSGRNGATSSVRFGGAGGGGGAKINRFFVPIANLGSTYSLTRSSAGGAGGAARNGAAANGNSGTAGGASTFASGSVTLTAGGGGAGAGGGTSSAAVGGTGGVATASGYTTGISMDDGTAGGSGGQTLAQTTAGVANGASNSGAAGGGGATGITAANATASPGAAGGTANGQTAGTGGTNPTPIAAPTGGSAAVAGVAGAGAGGGCSVGAADVNGAGAAANGYGGGGGGAPGHTTTTTARAAGAGGPGYIKLEWV